jgi:hypothetical protein
MPELETMSSRVTAMIRLSHLPRYAWGCLGLGLVLGFGVGVILVPRIMPRRSQVLEELGSGRNGKVGKKAVSFITITDCGGLKRLRLNAVLQDEFLREFARVTKYPPFKEGGKWKVAPDAEITITYDDGSKKMYQLLARAVLLDPETNDTWQFYMGLYLDQELHEIGEAVPVRPENPSEG